jgi:hypothetical protein
MGKAMMIPWVWNMCPSNYLSSVAYVSILGESRAFQLEIDIMEVEAPSSTVDKSIFSSLIAL